MFDRRLPKRFRRNPLASFGVRVCCPLLPDDHQQLIKIRGHNDRLVLGDPSPTGQQLNRQQ
jgi:hypothetical protein